MVRSGTLIPACILLLLGCESITETVKTDCGVSSITKSKTYVIDIGSDNGKMSEEVEYIINLNDGTALVVSDSLAQSLMSDYDKACDYIESERNKP